MGFEEILAKGGVLKKQHVSWVDKRKHGTSIFNADGVAGNPDSIMIPLGGWDDSGFTAIDEVLYSDTFGIPSALKPYATILENETCLGGSVSITIFNDSTTDFCTFRMALFKCREVEAAHLAPVNPYADFETNTVLGDPKVSLANITQHKNTVKLYNRVRTRPILPKQLVVLHKRFLAPRYMSSATKKNEEFVYGLRIEFDTPIQIKIEVHRKVYNVSADRP